MEARVITLDDDENPFQRGSLLENIRESTDNYVLEAMNDPSYIDNSKDKVAKKLDFPKAHIPISKEPKFIPTPKDQKPFARPEFKAGDDRSPVDQLEARHQERISKYQQMIAEEKAAIKKEHSNPKVPAKKSSRDIDPRPGQAGGGLSSYYNKLTEEIRLDKQKQKVPQKVLKLIRQDDRVLSSYIGTIGWRH